MTLKEAARHSGIVYKKRLGADPGPAGVVSLPSVRDTICSLSLGIMGTLWKRADTVKYPLRTVVKHQLTPRGRSHFTEQQ